MTEEIIIKNAFHLCQRLEQENKELKEGVLKWQKAFSRQYQINENKGYSKAEEKYRSALEEIRMYINKCMNSLCDNNCEYWNNCKGNYNINNILTKINEVLK